jgi:hypothetical protein
LLFDNFLKSHALIIDGGVISFLRFLCFLKHFQNSTRAMVTVRAMIILAIHCDGVLSARYVGGGRVPSSTGRVIIWLFLTIVTLTVWFGKVYSSK